MSHIYIKQIARSHPHISHTEKKNHDNEQTSHRFFYLIYDVCCVFAR